MYFSHSQNEPPTPLQGIRFAQKEAKNAKGIKTGASTDFSADWRDFNVFENSARPQLQGQRSTLDDTLAKIAKEIAAFRLEEERKSKQSRLPLTDENTHRLFWNNYLKRNDPKKLARAVKEREAQSQRSKLDDTLAKIAKEIVAFRLEEERKSKQSRLPLTDENTHRLFWNNYLKRNDPKKLARAVKEREAQSPETPLPTWISMWDSFLTTAAPSLPSATG